MTRKVAHSATLLPHYIESLLKGTDAEFGRYLANGDDMSRNEAERSALLDAAALTEVLTTIDQPEALEKAMPSNWARVAWIASTQVQRALALHGDDVA